jgi:hypothetical protein
VLYLIQAGAFNAVSVHIHAPSVLMSAGMPGWENQSRTAIVSHAESVSLVAHAECSGLKETTFLSEKN